MLWELKAMQQVGEQLLPGGGFALLARTHLLNSTSTGEGFKHGGFGMNAEAGEMNGMRRSDNEWKRHGVTVSANSLSKRG
jgi:hypothetical protein